MTGQEHDDGAAGRTQARLDVYDQAIADECSEEIALELAGYSDPADLRAILAENQQLREQRDGAYNSILLIATSLGTLAAFQLADNPDDTAWNIVNASAHALIAASPNGAPQANTAAVLCGAPVPDELKLLATGGCLGEAAHDGRHHWRYGQNDVPEPDLSNEPIGEIDV